MKPLRFSVFASLAFFAVNPLPAAPSTSSGQASPPNVLLIVSDDQGYHDLGVLLPELKTPALDRLAHEGARLSSFYVAWPACTPSRAAFLTGRYPQRNGIYDMIRNEAPDYGHKYTPAEYEVTFERIGGMDTREVILPAYLKEAGYASAIFGKWDLGVHQRFLPLQKGFDRFYGLVNTGIDFYTHERYGVPSMYRDNLPTEEDRGTYCTWLFEREALRFLEDHHARSTSSGQANPFFLYLPFNAPHGASSLDPKIRGGTQAPEEYRAMYPIDGPRYETETETRYARGTPYAGKKTERLTREGRLQEYRACVTAMDKSIGTVLDYLDEKRLAENTIVIFFSDNGGSGGADNGPLRGHKGDTWEGGIRVPCLVRWPGHIPAGTVSDEFLTSLEILPTLAAACGFTVPKETTLDGYDMLPVLQGKAKSPRESMFWQRKDSLGARVGDWKYVQMGGKEYLFNLADDLGEKSDLSKSNPEQFKKTKAAFTAWQMEMDAADPRRPFRDY